MVASQYEEQFSNATIVAKFGSMEKYMAKDWKEQTAFFGYQLTPFFGQIHSQITLEEYEGLKNYHETRRLNKLNTLLDLVAAIYVGSSAFKCVKPIAKVLRTCNHWFIPWPLKAVCYAGCLAAYIICTARGGPGARRLQQELDYEIGNGNPNDICFKPGMLKFNDDMHGPLMDLTRDFIRPTMDSFNNVDDWDVAHMGFLALRARANGDSSQIWGEYWQFRNYLVYTKYNRGSAWDEQIEAYMKALGI